MASHAVVLANRPALETHNRLSASFISRVRQTLDALAEIGVRHVAVVDGHHAEQLRDGLMLHELPQLRVEVTLPMSSAEDVLLLDCIAALAAACA